MLYWNIVSVGKLILGLIYIDALNPTFCYLMRQSERQEKLSHKYPRIFSNVIKFFALITSYVAQLAFISFKEPNKTNDALGEAKKKKKKTKIKRIQKGKWCTSVMLYIIYFSFTV